MTPSRNPSDSSQRDPGTTADRDTTRRLGMWEDEESYWRQNYSGRPYVSRDRDFEFYRPGYRYGVESAQRYRGRPWNDVERDLESGWNRYEHRGSSTWEEIKASVRDAWERVTGQDRESGRRG